MWIWSCISLEKLYCDLHFSQPIWLKTYASKMVCVRPVPTNLPQTSQGCTDLFWDFQPQSNPQSLPQSWRHPLNHSTFWTKPKLDFHINHPKYNHLSTTSTFHLLPVSPKRFKRSKDFENPNKFQSEATDQGIQQTSWLIVFFVCVRAFDDLISITDTLRGSVTSQCRGCVCTKLQCFLCVISWK